MKNTFRKIDKPLLIVFIIFCIFGLTMVFSSSSIAAIIRYHRSSYYFFINQLIFVVFSFIVGFIILKIPIKKYKYLSYLATLLIMILLVLVLFVGVTRGGSQSWFNIGRFSLQPSEFAKSIIILFLAFYYEKVFKKKNFKISKLFIPLTVPILAFFLIAKQPDLGSALVLAGITFLMFITLPIDKKLSKRFLLIIITTFITIGLTFLLLKDKILTENQLERFNYFNPCERYLDKSGYQVCNGFIAINNGGLFGVGMGASTQKFLYLPESHTDFIYPIIVEELGLITGIVVILLYAFIIYRIIYIARNSNKLSNSLIAFGTGAYILLHVVINLGGVLGLIPLTGVPLPLLSYGGSHIMNIIVMIFLTLRISIENYDYKYKEEIKKLSS